MRSGSTDGVTTPKMNRDLYNILPDNKVFLSVVGLSHIPLGSSCNSKVEYQFIIVDNNLNLINECKQYNMDIHRK